MKKLIFLGAMAVSLLASAKTLTPEQALSRVSEPKGVHRAAARQDLRLVYMAQAGEQPGAYVFQSPEKGFIVAAADDIAPAVLGYCDNGEFVLNDNVQYWLEEYSRQIEWANQHGVQPLCASERTDREAIAPWLTTKWNQNAPFNLLCPTFNGNQCVTGCVATALAQVMNFHQWPITGEGSFSYTCQAIEKPVSFDFGATTFDWSNMLDAYPNSGNDATEAQRMAVATLMKACGVGCEMNYSPSGSGALSCLAALSLVDYFKYDHGIEFLERNYYSSTEWDSIVYEQVKNGPLYFSGANSEVGHAFVLDGYDTGGYYHVNWGWGGMSDGYFLLTALDPSSQGIGGSNSGYNIGQEIICNVRPQGSTPGEYVYFVVSGDNDFTISESQYKRGELVTINTPVYNGSVGTISKMGIGLLFTSTDGQERFGKGWQGEDVEPFTGYTYTEAKIPANLDEGKYKVTYAWTPDGGATIYPVLVPYARRQSYTATVSGDYVTFIPDEYLDVELTNVEMTPMYVDQIYKVSAQVSNPNDREYSNIVYGFLVKDNKVVYTGAPAMLTVSAEGELDFTYYDQLDGVEAGNYDFWLATIHEGHLEELYLTNVNVENSSQKPNLNFGELILLNEDSNAVPTDNISLQATVSNTGGYFAGTVSCLLYVYDDNGEMTTWEWVNSQPLFIDKNQSATAQFVGSISDATTGERCRAQMLYDDDWVGNEIWFTLFVPEPTTPPARPNVTIGQLVVGDGENPVDPAQFVAEAPISVTNADYTGTAYLVIKTQMNITAYTFDAIEVKVPADGTGEFRFAADLSAKLKGNATYTAQLYVNNRVTGDSVKFKTIPKVDGIDTIDADQGPGVYYNLQGIPVTNPTPGIYILLTPDGPHKIHIQ